MGSNLRSSIVMDEAGVAALVHECRTATLATVGRDALPHLTPLWFAVEDDRPVFITKSRSQKVANLRRDPRLAVLFEAGTGYDELRGAVLEGSAVIDDDPERVRQIALGIRERYPQADLGGDVESSIRKRVAIALAVVRIRSWDHRSLGAVR